MYQQKINFKEMNQTKRKRRNQKLAFGIVSMLTYLIVLILILMLVFIIVRGIGVISWEFLSTAPTDGMTGGGILPGARKNARVSPRASYVSFAVIVPAGIEQTVPLLRDPSCSGAASRCRR